MELLNSTDVDQRPALADEPQTDLVLDVVLADSLRSS